MHLLLKHFASVRIASAYRVLTMFDFLIDPAPLFQLLVQLYSLFGGDHVVPIDEGASCFEIFIIADTCIAKMRLTFSFQLLKVQYAVGTAA